MYYIFYFYTSAHTILLYSIIRVMCVGRYSIKYYKIIIMQYALRLRARRFPAKSAIKRPLNVYYIASERV